jgi:hypothetical protein
MRASSPLHCWIDGGIDVDPSLLIERISFQEKLKFVKCGFAWCW